MTNPLVVVKQQFVLKDGVRVGQGVGLWIWCPGCDMAHCPRAVGEDGSVPDVCWTWNGAVDEGFTIEPSLLCYSTVHLCAGEHQPVVCPDPDNCGERGHLIMNWDQGRQQTTDGGERILGHDTHTRATAWGNCHSFIRSGQWQFLADCAHKLAGQTVPMVPVPDWLLARKRNYET